MTEESSSKPEPDSGADKEPAAGSFAWLDGAANLLKAIAWPMVVVLMLWGLRGPLGELISESQQLGVDAGPVKIELKRTANLLAGAYSDEDERPSIDNIEELLGTAISPSVEQRLPTTRILWVDDNPFNNRYVTLSLESLGMRITNALSTREAMFYLDQATFDVVITDMCRQESCKCKQAICTDDELARLDGYDLLARMEDKRSPVLNPPVIIYATYSGAPGHPFREIRQEARRFGAFARTRSPTELIQLIVRAIEQ